MNNRILVLLLVGVVGAMLWVGHSSAQQNNETIPTATGRELISSHFLSAPSTEAQFELVFDLTDVTADVTLEIPFKDMESFLEVLVYTYNQGYEDGFNVRPKILE